MSVRLAHGVEVAVEIFGMWGRWIFAGEEIDRFAAKVTVEEVMTHDIFIVRPETPLATAVGLLRRHRIGSLPVVQNKNLVGIITRSDILDFVLSDGAKRARKGGKKGSRGRAPKKGRLRRQSAKRNT